MEAKSSTVCIKVPKLFANGNGVQDGSWVHIRSWGYVKGKVVVWAVRKKEANMFNM